MKIKYLYISVVLLIGGVVTSCESYLDKMPTGDMSIEEVFSQYNFADRFLANTYMHLPNESNAADAGPGARNPFTAGCDEMEIAYGGSYTHLINDGGWNPSNIESMPVWSESYMGIRKASIFIENIDKVPIVQNFSEKTREARKGEAHFLRAFMYFHLLRCYGPVPLIKGSLPININVSEFKRTPLEECIQFVIEDCDRAAELLPIKYSSSGDLGRISKAAALALKSRLLLYRASPLWNGDTMFANFVDKDGEHLFSTSRNETYWKDAADAALNCIVELEANGYGLYKEKGDPRENYEQMVLEKFNKEWIFWRNLEWFGHHDNCGFPLSYGGFSILNPTQEIVDAYQMADGSTPITGYTDNGRVPIINGASGYQDEGYVATEHPQKYYPAGVRNMYVNREPRFYASVSFSGQWWKDNTINFWYTGKDGRRGAGSDYCKTGYLQRKNIDPSPNILQNTGRNMRCWIYLRLGEIYLNYAEAINEWEGPAKAYKYVNDIRNRAGLPALDAGLNKDQMRARIQHERRIELAFETHRFFDVRRWKIAENTEPKPVHGMSIMSGDHLQDNSYYRRILIENRVFEAKKHYLWPIPQVEIDRSERRIIQNPNWTTGE